MVACPPRAELRRYLIQDESLGPEQIERIESHVETCPSCQEILDALDEEENPPGTTMPYAAGLPRLQVPGGRGVRRGLAGPGPEPAAGRGGEDAQGGRELATGIPGRWRPSARTPT